MFEFLILAQFVSALVTLVVGVSFITFFRKRADNDVKENKAAGFWVRAICLGTDAAIIDLLLNDKNLIAMREEEEKRIAPDVEEEVPVEGEAPAGEAGGEAPQPK